MHRVGQRRSPMPLDRLAKGLMLGLLAVSALLLLLGDHAKVRVTDFSWQEHVIGADNTAFLLTFNRPMDTASVAANLKIIRTNTADDDAANIPGRISWAGRRMAYTLDNPIPYGETFRLELPAAHDRFSQEPDNENFEAFSAAFRSRDRAMVYRGTQGEEAGRLVLVNFSAAGDPQVLTPPNLTVLDFEPYPLGDRVLLSAIKTADSAAGEMQPMLYAVSTGLRPNPPQDFQAIASDRSLPPSDVGILTPILEDETYQNLAFDLSPDGRIIVVQRLSRTDPADFGPWLVQVDSPPQRLDVEPGGEFLIGPDSQTLLMLQGQGTAVIPLNSDSEQAGSDEPLDFLPEFGRVFDITRDGATAAMVNFNQNDPARRFTESLITVTNRGDEAELLTVTGSILQAQFDPTGQILYVLASQLLPGATYQEQPFLAAINLNTQKTLELLELPPQARASFNLSPDGLAALLEISAPEDAVADRVAVQTILLPLFRTTAARLSGTPAPTDPQLLPFAGASPAWLP